METEQQRLYRESLDNAEARSYDQGYLDATNNITLLLDKFISKADSAEDVMVEVTALIVGNRVILAGGSADEAMLAASLIRMI